VRAFSAKRGKFTGLLRGRRFGAALPPGPNVTTDGERACTYPVGEENEACCRNAGS